MQREITNQFLEVELPAIFYDEQGAQYIEFFAQLGQSYLLNLMELYFKHKEISFPYTHGDFIVEGGATKELAFLSV